MAGVAPYENEFDTPGLDSYSIKPMQLHPPPCPLLGDGNEGRPGAKLALFEILVPASQVLF